MPNYDMAYSGLGKASYRDGDYKEAMGLFKLGNNTDWYSRAYKEYRKTVVAKWFAPCRRGGGRCWRSASWPP